MENEMAKLLLTLIGQEDKADIASWGEQDRMLSAHPCNEPKLGKLMDKISIPFLLETLQMKEEYFVRLYADSDLTQEDRSQLEREISEHLPNCKHCNLKHDYDLENGRRTELLIETHKAEFAEALVKTVGG